MSAAEEVLAMETDPQPEYPVDKISRVKYGWFVQQVLKSVGLPSQLLEIGTRAGSIFIGNGTVSVILRRRITEGSNGHDYWTDLSSVQWHGEGLPEFDEFGSIRGQITVTSHWGITNRLDLTLRVGRKSWEASL